MQRHTITSLVLLFAASACNADGSAPAQPVPPSTATAAPTAAPAQPAPSPPATPDAQGVVRLSADDTMKFSTNRIEVKAGTKLKLELKNLGSLPKEAMGHNFVLLTPGTTAAAFGAVAMNAKATDYIPADGASMIIAHTKLLGPGEADTIELDAPAPGTYTYLCSFPGHFALMTGQLVVQ